MTENKARENKCLMNTEKIKIQWKFNKLFKIEFVVFFVKVTEKGINYVLLRHEKFNFRLCVENNS